MIKSKEIGRLVRRKKRYTTDEKIEALRILKENNYDFLKTSSTLKVAVNTLKTWNNTFRTQLDGDAEIKAIALKTENNMAQLKQKFLSQHFAALNELTEKTIKRSLLIVKKETDLSKLCSILKVSAEILTKLTPDNSQQTTNNNTFNLIQQSIEQCNMIEANKDIQIK